MVCTVAYTSVPYFRPRQGDCRADSEVPEAKVGHCTRCCSYIEGIARGDEDDVDAVAMGFGEQGIHCSARMFRMLAHEAGMF